MTIIPPVNGTITNVTISPGNEVTNNTTTTTTYKIGSDDEDFTNY